MEKLGHDGSRISSRAVQRRIGHVIHQVINALIGGRGGRLKNGLESKGHIGARITIWHRENIDAVQVLPALKHVTNTGRQRTQQTGRIEVGNRCG